MTKYKIIRSGMIEKPALTDDQRLRKEYEANDPDAKTVRQNYVNVNSPQAILQMLGDITKITSNDIRSLLSSGSLSLAEAKRLRLHTQNLVDLNREARETRAQQMSHLSDEELLGLLNQYINGAEHETDK